VFPAAAGSEGAPSPRSATAGGPTCPSSSTDSTICTSTSTRAGRSSYRFHLVNRRCLATVDTTIAQPLDDPRSRLINQAQPTERHGVEGRGRVGNRLWPTLQPSGPWRLLANSRRGRHGRTRAQLVIADGCRNVATSWHYAWDAGQGVPFGRQAPSDNPPLSTPVRGFSSAHRLRRATAPGRSCSGRCSTTSAPHARAC
jgi:hypothetical protein